MTIAQESLDAAAAEVGRQLHGGPADPDDIRLASDVLLAVASARPAGELAGMTLNFSDCDPVSACTVTGCGWTAHGDSINDALIAWGAHATMKHRELI